MSEYSNENHAPVITSSAQDDEVSVFALLSAYGKIVAKRWKWFVLSILVCAVLAFVYFKKQPYVYSRSAVMLVENNENGGYGGTSNGNINALLELNGVSVGGSLENEIFILGSHRLMERVVERLGLDVTYSTKSGLRPIVLYNNRPFDAMFIDSYTAPIYMEVNVASKDNYELRKLMVDNAPIDIEENKMYRFGQRISTPAGTFMLVPNPKLIEEFEGNTVSVTRRSVEDAALVFQSTISATQMTENGSLIAINCVDRIVSRADSILITLLDVYKRDIVESKNSVADNTARFIDQRINLIGGELSEVENELAQFKQANRIVDFSQNAEIYLRESASARAQTQELNTKLSVANFLLDYLRDASKSKELIPSIGGLGDQGLQQQIAKYNETMTMYNKLVGNSGEASPIISDLSSSLSDMRNAIIRTVNNYVNVTKVELSKAEAAEAGLSGLVANVPNKEKYALDIQRQQAIKNSLYTYLLNKREQVALQLAINEANVRVVEYPHGPRIPVSPRANIIMLAGLIIGILLPSIYFVLRAVLNNKVRGRKDIEMATRIPIMGEIPTMDIKHDADKIISSGEADSVAEAFRLLRYSLDFMKDTSQVIMLTSATPAQGKTFVSRNLAVVLGMNNKRVLLIDADLRKRQQSRLLGHGEGLTSYLIERETDPMKLILRNEPSSNVDFMPAGVMPPNPAELLTNGRIELLIEELRKHYDHIIFDCTPYVSVADAGIVSHYVDLTLFVVRVGKQERMFLPELEKMNREKMLKNLCIVLNDCSEGRYGYGYGYGYSETPQSTTWSKIKKAIGLG